MKSIQRPILYLSSMWWDEIWQRPQHIASRLSHSDRIVFVENITSIFGILVPRSRRRWGGRRRLVQWIRRESRNLTIVTPVAPLPYSRVVAIFRYLGIFARLNAAFIAKALQWMLDRLEIRDPIVLIDDPKWLPVVERLGFENVVYDCFDDRASAPNYSPYFSRQITEQEAGLIRRANGIIASSQQLCERLSRDAGKEVSCVPNGTGLVCGLGNGDRAADMAGIRRPVVGFVGILDNHMDIELLKYVIEQMPDVSFVLVGPAAISFDLGRIEGHSNVHLLGARRYAEIDRYIDSFDVCIIPYLVNQYTKSVDSIKVYDYLARGKPIVTTDLPEAEKYGEVIMTARGGDQFIEQIRTCLSFDSPEQQGKRVNIARENTWDARARRFHEILDNMQ